jgi:hypothetical protein
MHKLIVSIIAALLLSLASGAYASDIKGPDASKNCITGCGHERAPGSGTGQSQCWVTFVAADGYDDFKAQILAPSGGGLLKNAKGEVAIRGGEGTKRLSVDCSAILQGEKLVTCFTHDGKPVTRTIKGAMFKGFLPESHRQGGIEVKL